MKKIFYIALLTTSTGCWTNGINESFNSEDIIDSTKVTIDVTNALNNSDKQAIAENSIYCKIIPLETNDLSVVTSMPKICPGDIYYYIMDNCQNGNVALFDTSGHFVKRLPGGNAAAEIGLAQNVRFDKKEKKLFVYDQLAHKINKYEEDGTYLQTNYLETTIRDFYPLKKGFIIWESPISMEDNFRVAIIDSLGQYSQYWKIGQCVNDVTMDDNFQYIDNGYSFKMPFSNDIYSFTNNKVQKKYEILYEGMEEIDFLQNPTHKSINNNYKDQFFIKFNVKETNDHLWFFLNSGTMGWNIFFNKKTGIYWNVYSEPKKDLFAWISIEGVTGINNDLFVGLLEPSFLFNESIPEESRWDGSNPNNLLSPEDMEKLKNVKPDDNPIIVLFKLKDDI